MNQPDLNYRSNYNSLMMHDDIIECISLDLSAIKTNGYTVVDKDAVTNYFLNWAPFGFNGDDWEEIFYTDCDEGNMFCWLEKFILSFTNIEVNAMLINDILYIWDWHRYDMDYMIQMVA